jgi:hypothetical protein
VFIQGKDWRQGPHQEAQKSTRTTLPFKDLRVGQAGVVVWGADVAAPARPVDMAKINEIAAKHEARKGNPSSR